MACGLFCYAVKAQEGGGDGPTEILLTDSVFPVTGLLWAAGGGPANTTWVLVGIAVDLLVLYALVARGEGAAPPHA